MVLPKSIWNQWNFSEVMSKGVFKDHSGEKIRIKGIIESDGKGILKAIFTSMGSTSLAMTTSCAAFFSTRVVTVLMPCLTTAAFLVGASPLPAARASARSRRRSFFACFVSGRYLSRSLNSWVAKKTKSQYFVQRP